MRFHTKKHGLQLEVIEYHPAHPNNQSPLIFLHGANMSAWCWEAYFLPHFASLGYTCYALSLRGHGRSHGVSHLATASIDDYVEDLRDLITHLAIQPILIGHSMGSLVILKYLELQRATSAVLLAPVPLGGTIPSMLNLVWHNPFLLAQLNLLQLAGKSMLSMDAWNELIFSRPPEPAVLQRFCSELQHESPRALIDAAWLGLPTQKNPHQTKILMVGAGDDVFFNPRQVQDTAKAYNADFHLAEHVGHNLMLEQNWQDCANHIHKWLAA